MTEVLSQQKLYEMANELYSLLLVRMTGDDPETYIARANELAVWLATSSKMVSDARFHRDKAVKDHSMRLLADHDLIKLPASTINELIKRDCAEENHLANWIEELNKEIKHTISLLVTEISYYKTQMQYLNNQ